MIKIFIVGIVVLMGSIKANAQWTWQNPLPQGNNLTSVKVFDNGKVLAAGKAGTLIETKDNGSTWTSIETGYSEDFNSMSFVDANSGWLAGASGLLLKTQNGGETWEKIDLGDSLNPSLLSVYFLNADTGWVGSDAYYNNRLGTLFHTTDGGETWTSKNFSGVVGNGLSLENISFIDESFGWISSSTDQVYYTTTDGGLAWVKHIKNFSAICYTDTLNGLYTMGSRIYKTTDRGNSWNNISSFGGQLEIFTINFKNPDTGWVGGYRDNAAGKFIARTTDGGSTWTVDSGLTRGGVVSIDYNRSDYVWGVGLNGGILRSTDSGKTWDEISSESETAFNSVFFSDENNGWAVGGYQGADLTGFVYHTTDGGKHWGLQLKDSSRPLRSVFFISPTVGWAAGFNRIIKTTDGGSTWTKQYDGYANSIYFLDENTGWAVTNNQILSSTDGGDTWFLNNPNSSNNGYYNTIIFRDKDVGFIGGEGFILKTTNGGTSWDKTVFQNESITSICFSDKINGTAVSLNGSIFRTTDNGNTWTIQQSTRYAYHFRSVGFGGSKNGMIVGDRGTIFYSDDGGESWIPGKSPTGQNIYSVCFPNSSSGWIAGGGGIILKYSLGNGTTSVNNNKPASVPDRYCLEQNYPNPFNPSTKIEYSIPSSGFITMKIYDTMGREIKTLVNEYKKPGRYYVTTDLSNYPSGVYFYSIYAGKFTKMQKMVLIK